MSEGAKRIRTGHELGGWTLRGVIGRTWKRFWKDRILDQSATLSFYFLLSLFPLLLFLFALLGFLLQSGPQLRETLHESLAAVVPQSASGLIDRTLGEIIQGAGAIGLSTALLFTWWSASQGMLAIIDGLNIAYQVKDSRPWLKKFAVASGLTMGSLAMLAAALMMLLYGGRLSDIVIGYFGFRSFLAGLWQALQWLLLLAFALMAFNLIYFFAPNVERRRWRWLMPGTVAGVSLWLAVSFGFKVYLIYFNSFTVTYGSIGAVIILLLWFYLTGIAILVGGEVNAAIDEAVAEGR
jgi:membrane protein